MADNTVARFNFQFTSNADALSSQWEGLIKQANKLVKITNEANKVLDTGVKIRREEVEVNHKRIGWRNKEIDQETLVNKLRDKGNKLLTTRMKKLGALALAAVSMKKLMGGGADVFRSGVDVARTAKSLGESPASLENYAKVTERFGGDRGSLFSNLANLSKQLGDVDTKGESPILRLSQALGFKLRDGDNNNLSKIEIHKSILDMVAGGSKGDRDIMNSLLAEMGMDRSGALMAGISREDMRKEEVDVMKQYQRSQKESDALIELSRSLTEMAQSISSLLDKIIGYSAPSLNTGVNILNDLMQGDSEPAADFLDSAFKSFQGNPAAQGVKNFYEEFKAYSLMGEIQKSLHGQREGAAAPMNQPSSSINTTNNNLGGMVNNFTLGQDDQSNDIIDALNLFNNTWAS